MNQTYGHLVRLAKLDDRCIERALSASLSTGMVQSAYYWIQRANGFRTAAQSLLVSA